MFHIALYQPEIPPNTGNIMRLCANTGFSLHLIHPLGFELDNKKLRRAGMDYRDIAVANEYPDYASLLERFPDSRIIAFTTKAKHHFSEISYSPNDILLFGPETRGLPDSILQSLPPEQLVRIPMQAESRSLNLSNTAAIAMYETLRQHDYPNLN